jgi:ankyrin repeat protein
MASCPNSSILDLCKHRDWRRVELECKREPLNATYICGGDDYGAHPLHIACKKQPTARVVRELLKAYPQAAYIPNDNGYLPLHLACMSNSSIEVLRTLTDNEPRTASMMTSSGETTITVLARARDKTENNIDFSNSMQWQSETPEFQKINYTTIYWQKVQVLLEAIAIHRQRNTLQCVDDLFTLHAAVSLNWCPAEVLHFCCVRFPDQIQMRDDYGRLPLHVAVGHPAYCRSNETLLGKLQIREKSIVLPRLLKLYPDAARCNDPQEPKGRYPLHSALVNNHEWHGGVKELLQQFPDAALCVDPIENLYPFQMASHDLDTVFQLLRSAPSALINSMPPPKYDNVQTNCIGVCGAKSEAIYQMQLHSSRQSTPHVREKRGRFVTRTVIDQFETNANVACDEALFEDFVLSKRETGRTCEPCHSDVVWVPVPLSRVYKNFYAVPRNEDILISSDDLKMLTLSEKYNSYTAAKYEVVWNPPSYEKRIKQFTLDKVHSIQEIIVKSKRNKGSKRREGPLSSIPSIIMTNVESESSDDDTTVGAEVAYYEPSLQSLDTRVVRNFQSGAQSACSETITDESMSSNTDSIYNKYKCMISGPTEVKYTHEWKQDVVKKQTRSLYKQPSLEIMGLHHFI